jgi:hypothetical protein
VKAARGCTARAWGLCREFFHRGNSQEVTESGEIIYAVSERDALRIRLRFAGFFDAGVNN